MAPVQHLYRLTFGGKFFDTEGWSNTFHIGSATGFNHSAGDFETAIKGWLTRVPSKISSAAHLDFIKCNEIAPLTGRYVLDSTNEVIGTDLGAGSCNTWPPQNTVVISTRTAKNRGRAHAGRLYPPTGNVGVDPVTGLIDSTIVDGMVTSALTMVREINTLVGAGSELVVFSKLAQEVEPIIGVRVGRVVDTMRTRRKALLENYSEGHI